MHARRTQGRWRRRSGRTLVLPLGVGLLLALLLPALAWAQGAGADSVTLAWTAPGDDNAIGRATTYDVRMSTSQITSANFASATAVAGAPAPANAGTRQTMTVRGLTRGTTYWFAIKTVDDAGNWSAISNVVRWDWILDTAPPSAPSGLAASMQGSDGRVQWSANGEPDLAGYNVYRATSQNGTYTRVNAAMVTGTQFTDTALPAGVSQVWYKVTALDGSGNESARSAAVALSLSGTGGALAGWSLEPAYPNPSRGGQPVSLPVTVASTGTGEIQIADAARRLVRRIDLRGLSTGPQTVVWDGLNDAGRPVAPGVYTVWIVAGSDRRSVRVVRTP